MVTAWDYMPAVITFLLRTAKEKDCGIDVKVKMIYDDKEGDIINQYVIFTKVCNEQMKKHGRTRKAGNLTCDKVSCFSYAV